MRAVMYGAGNIGRGFVGALMSRAGYRVAFVDVDRELVARLNAAGEYTLRVIGAEGHQDTTITNVHAVDGTREEEVVQAVAECDLMATAVGARILPRIAPLLARGIQRRFAAGRPPLNIIICENLMDANRVLESLIKDYLTPEEQARFDREVGLVEASIGRMVPVQTDQMREGDPLRVCVEAYAFLPVDKDAIRGDIPPMEGLVPYSPFDYYLRRKLYLHNMGHAGCAYLGMYLGKAFIYESVGIPGVELLTRTAMAESIAALSRKYEVPAKELMDHRDDLVYRFHNKALGDSCARVGADIPRKMASEDRLIGAARLCQSQGIPPVYIALNAGAALYHYLCDEKSAQDEDSARQALLSLSGLNPEDELALLILRFHRLFAQGAPLDELIRFAREEKHRLVGPVV